MPFTFSHPAIILPLYRFFKKWVSLTGLIVGSIIPDFEYFIRMQGKRNYSHSITGMFWFDLPLAIIVCFIYHSLVRNPFISHLPFSLHSRLSVFKQFNWNKYVKKNWITVIVCILIGTFSHLVWDHLVHEKGYVLQFYSYLNNGQTNHDLPIPEYDTLHIINSIAGGIFVLYAIFQLPVKDKIRRPFFYKYWLYLFGIIAIVMTIRFLTGLKFDDFNNIIINFISCGIIAIILVSLFVRRQYYR